MYNLKVADFVDITENLSSFDVEDMIHICKRKNNTKREYLFVNKYQGKHYPVSPNEMLKLFNEFFEEIKKHFYDEGARAKIYERDCERKVFFEPNPKLLVVGFAETATALGEFIALKMQMDSILNYKYGAYMQTTRENIDNVEKYFTFSEEHSHAVNQSLYFDGELPLYDHVLFIEDEITTGKTILNFIEKFKEKNPNCKYSVASLVNWQNDANIALYNTLGINRISLIFGKIKKNIPNITILPNTYENIKIDEVKKVKLNLLGCVNPIKVVDLNYCNSRVGLLNEPNGPLQPTIISSCADKLKKVLKPENKIMLVGTEEFMFYPFMISLMLEGHYESVKYRATTRSPIDVCNEKGYLIKDSIQLPSAYDKERETYLYNLSTDDYDTLVLVTEMNTNIDLFQSLYVYLLKQGIDLIILQVGEK